MLSMGWVDYNLSRETLCERTVAGACGVVVVCKNGEFFLLILMRFQFRKENKWDLQAIYLFPDNLATTDFFAT